MVEDKIPMENSSDKKKMIREPLLSTPKGGFRTLPFIIANEAFESVASYGLTPNMIVYLMKAYNMEMASGSNILYFWSATTNFTPILGAFLADSFVGRFRMIGFGSIFSLLGMILLWLTTMIPEARPPPCDQSSGNCKLPNTFQLILLCSSFGLMSIGAGGIRSSSLAFGADQLKKQDNIKNANVLESYFSWYYASTAFSVLVAMTCVVYIQDTIGWKVGFGVPVVLMFLAALSFLLASPFYVKSKAKTSLLTGFFRVIIASYTNRHLELSMDRTNVQCHRKNGSMLVVPSEKLRFLNKACIIRDPDQEDSSPDGKASNPWNLCTIDQVEELKAVIKVIPLWSTGIVMSLSMSQGSFSVLQASSMDRHITPNLEIPAGSFGMFLIISIMIWVALYDRVILPMASKIMGKPVHLTPKQRMGIGLSLSFTSMVVTATVENFRRAAAIKEGYSDDPHAQLSMSAIWVIPQHCLNGFAEALNVIGQNEFYYSEFPRSMSSISTTLFGVGMFVANLLASFLMSFVDDVTKRGGSESWVSSNINKGHYDYYYLLLAGLSLVNIVYFLVCSRAYGPCEGGERKVWDEEDEVRDE